MTCQSTSCWALVTTSTKPWCCWQHLCGQSLAAMRKQSLAWQTAPIKQQKVLLVAVSLGRYASGSHLVHGVRNDVRHEHTWQDILSA